MAVKVEVVRATLAMRKWLAWFLLMLVPCIAAAQTPGSFPRVGLVSPQGYEALLTPSGQLQLTTSAPSGLPAHNPGGSGFPRYGFVNPRDGTGLQVDNQGRIHVTLDGMVSVTPGGNNGDIQTNNAGTAFGAYAGASCTNQFPRSTDSAGAWTCASVAIGSDVSGLGAGVGTFLGTPSSANLLSALTDKTGTGVAVFGTAPTFTTSLTSPLVLGGSAAGSTLTLQSTSGVGTTDTIAFKVGNNGAITAGTIDTAGLWTLGSGDNQNIFPANTTTAQRLYLLRGTDAAPDTQLHPLIKAVRTLATDATGVGGDGGEQLAAIEGIAVSTAAGQSQPVGVYGAARNSGTVSASSDVRADAVGFYGVGRITGAGAIGAGFGAVLVGRRDVDTGRVTVIEVSAQNYTATPGTYTANGASNIKAQWIYCNGDSDCGVAIQIQNAFGRRFATGLGFGSQNTGGVVGPTVDNDIRTDSTAAIAYDLRGTHATAAIQDTSTSALGIFLNGTNTDSAIRTASTAGNANFGTTNVAGRRVNAFLSSTAQATNAVGGWFSGQAAHASGGAMASVIGVQGQAILNSTQGATTLASVRGLNAHIAAGTVTDSAALLAAAATNSGGATITRAMGLYLESQTVGSTNYQIYSVGTAFSHFAGPIQVDNPATQTIAGGDTIAADACMSIKNISSASAVTTNTTNTFTAPAALNKGCFMMVCNVNAADAITLDKNANFLSTAGADVVLLANSCIGVFSTGGSGVWRQVTAIQTST